ncbi:MAG: DUF3179 domain-containing (seleno)protein [Acidobacteria bacterium]|nr:DUF3179 domain-containing (seleno)protein [Acidobacteriota bacterium]
MPGAWGAAPSWKVAAIAALLLARCASPAAAQPETHPDIELFLTAAGGGPQQAQQALDEIEAQWRPGYAGMVWDLARLLRPPSPRLLSFVTILRFLEQQTGQQLGQNLGGWNDWVWAQPYEPHPDYAFLKGQWYSQIDPGFADFFPRGAPSAIRLDEIEWGGVAVNGIPPLEYPERLAAADAAYLADDHVVFGIAMNGEARAYPKRILAWHEMALDRVGGVELTVVYCTLCGTVIPFESVADGQHHKFGTSGLLYRSNKLMFDHGTKSLWNTFEGVPVVGPLVGSGRRLTPHAVVTTTWGEWRARHPDTTVLSLETGHRRNYAEGAAYRAYFGTDALMFQVSRMDARLLNKEEVVVMRFDDPGTGRSLPLAITAGFLAANRVFHHRFAGRNLVVVTSEAGANRVYDAGDTRFVQLAGASDVADDAGRVWRLTEDALVLASDAGERRPRLPAQRAFWFGWYAQFPATELIR